MEKESLINEFTRIFDSHEHFGYHGEYSPKHPGMTLKDVINCAYMNVGNDADDYAAICQRLHAYKGSARFLSLRAALLALYDEDISPPLPSTLRRLDQAVRNAHEDPRYTYTILEDIMGVSGVVQDVPPDVWVAWKDPLMGTTIRLDELAFPFIKDYTRPGTYTVSIAPHQLDEYAESNGLEVETLDDFDDAIENLVSNLRDDAVSLKIGTAYQRGIDFKFEENLDGGINGIYKKVTKKGGRITETEVMRWSNYVISFLISYATVEQLPVQVHTGLATMAGTNPVNLIDMMKAFPSTHFCLFHGGYPYHQAITGVLDMCPNAHVDLCWMPILSQVATRQLLAEIIEMGHVNRAIAFGGDCTCIEGSLGALLILKHILADVLLECINSRLVQPKDAVDIGNRILEQNGRTLLWSTSRS